MRRKGSGGLINGKLRGIRGDIDEERGGEIGDGLGSFMEEWDSFGEG